MDYSKCFTVEIYGEKGWEIACYFTSWIQASGQAEIYAKDHQVRVTSPMKAGNELLEKIEKIQEEHSKGLTTTEEFAERVTLSVLESL